MRTKYKSPYAQARARLKKKKQFATLGKISKMNIAKSLGFPNQKRCTLKLVDSIVLTSGVGTLTSFKYGANCVFDPFLGAGGHQPFGFDQWMTYYNHCIVVSSAVRLSVINAGSGTIPAVGLYLADDETAYTLWSTFCETNRGQQVLLPYNTNQAKPAVVSCKFMHKSFFKDRPNGGAEFLNTTAVNATEQAVYHVYVQDSQIASSVSIIGRLEIIYDVIFCEPKDLVAS